MALELNIPLNDSDNITFNESKVKTIATGTSLKLTDNTLQTFDEDFIDDVGFVYDSELVEFVAGESLQKDKRPANATFHVPYTNNINGSWGNGVLAGTPIGGADVSSGILDLNYSDIRYVDYDAVLNGNSGNTGCIRIKNLILNYSGAPGVNIGIISESNSGTIPDSLVLYHTAAGQLWFQLYCGAVLTVSIAAPWSPTLGIGYDIEINWNVVIGESRIFIEGTQFSSTNTSTGNRATNMTSLKVGSFYNGSTISNFSIDGLIIFSTVQHTANYTPDWSSIYDTIYVESKVELPQFAYTGIGNIQAFTNLVTIETGTPKYVVNDLYYSSGWVSSNGTYLQANTIAEILAQIATLPASDTVNVDLIFKNSNSQSNVDNLTLTYTGQIYPVDNQKVDINNSLNNEGILSFIDTLVKTGNDEVK